MLALLATLARAEDSTFAGAATPIDEMPPETHLTAELGGAFATGNADYYAVNSLVNASHQVKRNKVTFTGGASLGAAKAGIDADGDGLFEDQADEYTENVRRAFGDLRYDRFLGERDSLYALVGALHDPFTGYDLRSHEQIGYSHLFKKDEDTEVKGEIGADLAQEVYAGDIDPPYRDILAARILVGISQKLDDDLQISEQLEVYENLIDFEDVRVLNTAALTISLSGKFSLKLSHNLMFDNVPVEGVEPLDQTTLLTLVASIL